MKKLLSVICMAVIAGGLLFSSCGKSYTITVNTNNDGWGTVTGGGSYAENATATLTAVPNAGYTFVKWNDGNTTNPRTITVVENATYTAYFEAISVEPTVNVNFDGQAWSAGAVVGSYFPSEDLWNVLARQVGSNLYPTADLAVKNTAIGTISDNCSSEDGSFDNNSDIGWVEYYKSTFLYNLNPQGDTVYYGDWWAKSANINIAAFDATALTLTSSTNAVMFDAGSALADGIGVDAAATANMSINMSNIALQRMSSSKKAPVKSYKNLRVAR